MYKTAAWAVMAALALTAGASCKKKEKGAAEEAGGAAKEAAPTPTEPAGSDSESGSAGSDSAAAAEAEAKAKAAAAEEADAEKAQKQAALDYATMEDKYLNDAKGQWATAAKASSAFGSAGKEPPESTASSTPFQTTGAPNGDTWTNDHQDMGFDWLELTYANPVHATELRIVQRAGVGSLAKVELFDEAGAAHEIWSGTDDAKQDRRGPRTWVVRTFEKTPYKAVKAKLTFANAVVPGYKEVDAVQLVGE